MSLNAGASLSSQGRAEALVGFTYSRFISMGTEYRYNWNEKWRTIEPIDAGDFEPIAPAADVPNGLSVVGYLMPKLTLTLEHILPVSFGVRADIAV